jgi:aspartyl protease family protein
VGSTAKHALREAMMWLGLALAGLTTIYFYDDLVAAFRILPTTALSSPSGRSGEDQIAVSGFGNEVRVRADPNGHFVFDASINGRPVTMMADTGATVVVLSFEDAEKLGLSPRSLDFSGAAKTANGIARVAPLTLDRVRIDDITLHDVPAAVAERGALSINLLGMSFLSKLSRFQMKGSELVLVQ